MGCNNNNSKSNPEKFLGNDYRLFKDSNVSELAKAVEEENVAKIKEEIIQKKINVDYQEPKYGSTLLMLAIMNNQYLSAKTLIEFGANPNISDSYKGESAMIWAAKNNDPKYLKLLLKNNGNPNRIDNCKFKKINDANQTPLLAAISPIDPHSLEKVKILVEAGADINNYNSKNIKSPLSKSIIIDKLNIAYYLLINGADYDSILYNTVDGKEIKILQALRRSIIELNSEQYKYKIKIIKFLEEKGLDYRNEPIPDFIVKEIKSKYPDNWQNYIENY